MDSGEERRAGASKERRREHGSNLARLETALVLKKTIDSQHLQKTALCRTNIRKTQYVTKTLVLSKDWFKKDDVFI